jgi:hypothetical protein
METVQRKFWIEKLRGALPVLLNARYQKKQRYHPRSSMGNNTMGRKAARILPHSEEVKEDKNQEIKRSKARKQKHEKCIREIFSIIIVPFILVLIAKVSSNHR